MFSKNIFRFGYQLSQMSKRRIAKDVGLIGVPFGGGQPKDGVEQFPRLIREAGLVSKIESFRRNVTDYGDIEIPEYSNENPNVTLCEGRPVKNANECGLVSERLAKSVKEIVDDDKICVTLGGDHSVAVGSILGHWRAKKDLCVIWVDTHNDMNNHLSSPSGNIHGMTLSFLLKYLPVRPKIPGFDWTEPCLSHLDLVYVSLRETDEEEYRLFRQLGINVFSMHDIDKYGIANVLERAVECVNPVLDRPIHVSFDIDSVDPLVAPGTGTPVPGGLTYREVIYIGEYINKLGLLSGLDVVEVNPSLCRNKEDGELTMFTAMSVIEAFLGWHRPGYVWS